MHGLNNCLLPRRTAASFCFFLLTACTPVAPWQRGNLAKPYMALETNPPAASIRHHVQASKEASSGGYGSGGGGCGCN